MSDSNTNTGKVGQLLAFMKDVYAPGFHLFFAAVWFFALNGFLVSVIPGIGKWIFNPGMILVILTMFLVVLVLEWILIFTPNIKFRLFMIHY